MGVDREALHACIEAAICAIPAGRTASYGEIALRAGAPGRARLVGFVLRTGDKALPWHRILRADGRSAFANGSDGFRLQWQRLASEGVHPDNTGRVQPIRAPLRDDMDAEIWNPDPIGAPKVRPQRPSSARRSPSPSTRNPACHR